MDPAAVIAARSRNKAQTIGVAAGPMQGLAIAHCRKVIELDQPPGANLAPTRRLAQLRATIDAKECGDRIERTALGAAAYRRDVFALAFWPTRERPDARRVEHAEPERVAGMIEDQRFGFSFCRAESAADLLQIQREGFGRPQQDHGDDRWHVEPFGNEAAIAEYLNFAGAECGDKIAALVCRRIAVDMRGASTMPNRNVLPE